MALDLNTMHLTFDDEFNSLSLYNGVSGTWNPTYGYGSNLNNFASHVHGEEKQIYVDPAFTGTTSSALGVNPFSIHDGILDITAAPTSPALLDALGGYQYTSGLITTQQSFQQTYGYFEMSAKLPQGQGFWPAFWLLPAGGWGPPEIDVMEMLGNNPSTIYTTAHSTASGQLQSASFASNVADTSAGFHRYGVDWEPDQITWYFDGQRIAQTATPADMHSPMYMLANLAVGGNWPGSPDATTAFPANMQIDYIRAYAPGPGPSGVEGATAPSAAAGTETVGTTIVPEATHPTSSGGTTTAATAGAMPDTNLASGSAALAGSGSTAGATTTPDTNLASESHAASASGAAVTSEGNVANLATITPLVDQFLGNNGSTGASGGAGDGDGVVGGAGAAGDGGAAPALSDPGLTFSDAMRALESGLWQNVVEEGGQGLGSIGRYTTDLQHVQTGLRAEVAAGQFTGDTLTHVNSILADITGLSATSASADAPHTNLAEIGTIFNDLANISHGGFDADNSSQATADVNAVITGMRGLTTANPLPFGGLTGVHGTGAASAGIGTGVRGESSIDDDGAHAAADAGTGAGAGVGGCSHNSQGNHGTSIANDVAALLQAMQSGNAAINGAVTPFNDVPHAEAAEAGNVTAALNNHHQFEVLWHH